MSNHQEVIDLAKALTGNENLYSVQPFIKIAGDTLRGLFLERIVYWSDRSGNERLRQLKTFYKSSDEWEDELGLSYAQVALARKKLEELGFIQTSKRKVGGAPTLHYCANIDAIKEAVTLYYKDKTIDYANLDKPEIEKTLISENGNIQIQESAKTIEIQESAVSLNNSSNSSSNSKELAPKKIASPEQNKLFLILAGLCRIELKVATDKQFGQLDQAAKALIKTIKDSDQFKEKFGAYWLTVDWRGKQGQPPTPAQIREAYGDYCHWLENGQQQTKGQNSNGHKQQRSSTPVIQLTPEEEARYRRMEEAYAAANGPL